MQCLYVDLDATLLGPGGSLLAGAGGTVDLLGARALEACHRAGVEVCVMTGRGRPGSLPVARAAGARACGFEAGACVVIDGEDQWLTHPYVPEEGRTVREQITDCGALQLLLTHFDLQEFLPYTYGREATHLLRGSADGLAATALLAEHGHAGLRLLDNGTVGGRADTEERVFLLVPQQVSKAAAVAYHQQVRGYDPAGCVAVGDSREDVGMAASVGAFWLVANALEQDASIRAALAPHPNAHVCEGSYGAGVYEAVVSTLAARRG